MKRTSMEGFGVIDLVKLHQYREAFSFFTEHLSYPNELEFDSDYFNACFKRDFPGYEQVLLYWKTIQNYDLEELQGLYIETFDFHKSSTLYLTYPKFQDSKERGQMLARLKVLYEMYGLTMPKGELSDYLPIMCEFIYAGDWLHDDRSPQSFSLLFAVLEDGTYHLLQSLEEQKSPYVPLVKGLRAILKSCVKKQGVEAK
jgi:nitrate reductase molybdenum cofactor assembly chaperone NarJ/NarW